MSLLAHVVVATLGIQLMGLRGPAALLAYAFGPGVLLLDVLVRWSVGLSGRNAGADASPVRRTALVEPISLLWIIPLSVYSGGTIPVVFATMRLAFDYLAGPSKQPFFPFTFVTVGGAIATAHTRTVRLGVIILAALGLAISGPASLADLFNSFL